MHLLKVLIVYQNLKIRSIKKQESPPAWTQEAYHPPCSEYSFCCPTRVPPPGGRGYLTRVPPGGYLTRVPPQGGVPDPGTPGGSSTPGGTWPGYPPGGGLGTPGGGSWPRYPPWGGTWPGYPGGVPDLGTPLQGGTWPRYPPRGVPDPGTPAASWHSGKCCKALWDMGTPPVDRQNHGWTDACQNITFPHPSDAGGNNFILSILFATVGRKEEFTCYCLSI